MTDQYDELSKIQSLHFLIDINKSLGNYSKAQAYEHELLQLLLQKKIREQAEISMYRNFVGRTDEDTDDNIFKLVLSLIRNEDEFVRFVFEELDGASLGEGIALDFVNECGIDARYYKGTLSSASSIDRAGGPQQLLTSAVNSIYGEANRFITCFHRIKIVKKFIKYGMKNGYLNKYASWVYFLITCYSFEVKVGWIFLDYSIF